MISVFQSTTRGHEKKTCNGRAGERQGARFGYRRRRPTFTALTVQSRYTLLLLVCWNTAMLAVKIERNRTLFFRPLIVKRIKIVMGHVWANMIFR